VRTNTCPVFWIQGRSVVKWRFWSRACGPKPVRSAHPGRVSFPAFSGPPTPTLARDESIQPVPLRGPFTKCLDRPVAPVKRFHSMVRWANFGARPNFGRHHFGNCSARLRAARSTWATPRSSTICLSRFCRSDHSLENGHFPFRSTVASPHDSWSRSPVQSLQFRIRTKLWH